MIGAMGLVQHLMPSLPSRRTLAALLTYLALLMPALLPYGAHPAASILPGVAPHAHADGTDPGFPHDHGGSTDGTGAAAPLLLAWSTVDQLLAAPLPPVSQPRAGAPQTPAYDDVPQPERPYSRAQPRGPPEFA